MIETLKSCERTAKKRHVCNLCGAYIEPGEKYDFRTHIFGGDIYDWKSHKECSFIASEIWDYADPDEGMNDDDFLCSVQELCTTFVCPDCESWDKEAEECSEDCVYCVHKLHETLQKKELYRTRDKHNWLRWKLRERKDNG